MDILKNKSYKEYSRLSRYSAFPYYYNTKDNKYVSGTTAYLDDTTTYTNHIVEKGDTYDTLALEYYNNPTYFWVICSFNHVQDPFETPLVGTTLKIPSIALIQYE